MTTRTRPRAGAGGIDLRALPITLKIAMGLGVVLLVSAIFTSGLVRQSVEAAQTDSVQSELASLSRAQGFRVVDLLGQELVALSTLGADETVQAQLRSNAALPPTSGPTDTPFRVIALMQQQINPFKTAHPELDTIALIDAQGYVVAINPVQSMARNPGEAQPEPGSWLWYQDTLAGGEGKTYISGPIDDRLTGRSGVHLAIPIHDSEQPGEIIGVLYSIWNLSNIPEPAQVRSREAIIAELDGSILQATSDLGSTLPTSLLNTLQQSPAGSFVQDDPGGRPWLYGYVNVNDLGLQDETVSSLNWLIITREPLSITQADINTVTRRVTVAVGLSAVLVTVGVAGLTLILLRPLRHLTDAANQISAGNLDTEIPVLPHDELGNLADVLRGLVARLTHRLEQLNSAVQVSQATAYSLEVGELLNNVADSMYREFEYPAILIYQTDIGGREARVQAMAGPLAATLRTAEKIEVNERTAVGRAILLGEPQLGRIASGTLARRAELALALRAAGRSLGAMYIVAPENEVLEQEDIDVLNLIADQLSASIENARLFEQSASNLAEIEALNRRLTRQAWEEYLDEDTLRHTRDPEAHWPGQMDVLKSRKEISTEVFTNADGRSVLAAPIVLRGETIGTLAVTRPGGETWSRDERLLMESIASRLAMIAEGIRLVEETTQRATREQQVNEVSANLLQRAASVDTVLQTALDQLSGVLGSDHVSLRIGRPPIDDDRQIGAGTRSDPGNGQHRPEDEQEKEN